jgi:hypothetical protein
MAKNGFKGVVLDVAAIKTEVLKKHGKVPTVTAQILDGNPGLLQKLQISDKPEAAAKLRGEVVALIKKGSVAVTATRGKGSECRLGVRPFGTKGYENRTVDLA